MTAVMTAKRAAVVVETEWVRPATKRRPEATVTYRTAHADEKCPKTKGGTIVARDVDVNSPDAGLPCEWCFPEVSADVVVTQAERDYEANRPERPSGTGNGSRRAPISADAPTESQAAFWRNLMTELLSTLNGLLDDENKLDVAEHVAKSEAELAESGKWTRRYLRETAIDSLKTAIAGARKMVAEKNATGTSSNAPAAAAVRNDGVDVMDRPNRYGGDCARCGVFVAEGSGLLGKRAGKWVAVHRDGDCSLYPQKSAETDAPASRPTATLADVPEGHYAISTLAGENDLSFYRVDRPTEGRHAGRVFVKQIVGGHPDSNVPYARIAGILTRIDEAGIAESARLYGQKIGSCARCNRHLTHAISRYSGFGPKCREILGIDVSAAERELARSMALRLGWDVELDGTEKD